METLGHSKGVEAHQDAFVLSLSVSGEVAVIPAVVGGVWHWQSQAWVWNPSLPYAPRTGHPHVSQLLFYVRERVLPPVRIEQVNICERMWWKEGSRDSLDVSRMCFTRERGLHGSIIRTSFSASGSCSRLSFKLGSFVILCKQVMWIWIGVPSVRQALTLEKFVPPPPLF